jgi:hypothetical protein
MIFIVRDEHNETRDKVTGNIRISMWTINLIIAF